jgi:hypothetical protein
MIAQHAGIDMKNTWSFILMLCGVTGKFICDVLEYILVNIVPLLIVFIVKLILFTIALCFTMLFVVNLFDVSEKP